jgi:hypothetical protein
MDLKESLFLGFCAVCILLGKMAFHWKLHVPGHSMFFVMFFLLLAKGCVTHRFSAAFTGLLAGLMSLMLGMGSGGPAHLLKYVVPGLVLDGFAAILPGLTMRYATCLASAAFASFSKFVGNAAVDWLVGMDPAVLLQHALLQSASAVLFGVAGSLLIVPVMHRLKAHGYV